MSTDKSRELNLIDFYSILQKECISYLTRSIIYPDQYKKKYENFLVLKKEKVLKIGEKYSYPSIFDNQSIKTKFIEEFLPPFGLPNFEYRDDKSIQIMGYWDRVYWFGQGIEIRVKIDQEFISLPIIRNLTNISTVVVDYGGRTLQVRYECIRRELDLQSINI